MYQNSLRIRQFFSKASQENPTSVGDWLSRLGLSHYEPSFVGNGFDDIRFLVGLRVVSSVTFRDFHAVAKV